MPDFQHELDVAREVAVEGGRIALRYLGSDLRTERKSDGSWVSEADRAVEDSLRHGLARAFPTHNILGEEEGLAAAGGGEPVAGAPTWIVDPIDGTNNFISGIPIWATLVALRVDDRSVVGVCHCPSLGETYEAAAGSGARMNGSAIAVAPDASLDQATVAFASVQGFFDAGLQPFFERLVAGTWRSRGFGDFWGHMLVARGAVHVMVEPNLNVWDVAALQPIVAEAGGTLSRLDGSPWRDMGSCLTTNGALHEEVLELFSETTPGWAEEG